MTGRPDSFMPWYIGDYLADTAHLTTVQHGAYMLLLGAYWMRGAALDDDDEQLSAITKLSAQEWRKQKRVLSKFFTVENGVWTQKRTEQELEKAEVVYEVRRESSQRANDARWAHRRMEKAASRSPSRTPSRTKAEEPRPIRDAIPHGSQPQPHTKILTSYTAPRASAGHEGRAAHGVGAKPTKARAVKPSDVVVAPSTALALQQDSPLADSIAKLREARIIAALRAQFGKDEASRIWAGYIATPQLADCVERVTWISNRDGLNAS